MNIELGPAASRLLQTQARAAGMDLNQWIEHLAVKHEDGQAGAQIIDTPTAVRRTEVLEAVEGVDIASKVHVRQIKDRIGEANPGVAVTQIGNLLSRLGVERGTDKDGGYYNVGQLRQAIIDAGNS